MMNEYIVTVNCLGNVESMEQTNGHNEERTAEAVLESVDGMVMEFYVYASSKRQAVEIAESEWRRMATAALA
jgi:gamma-glutamylcyclotransferase (GGCT)/AIG2-like uncharacterized protein YtfP